MNLKIDIFQLEKECAEQSQLLYDAGVALAEANYKYVEAKNNREKIEADLDFEIRKDFKSFGLTKVTENSIANTIKLQKSYQKALEAERKLEYERDLARAKRDAYGQRGSLLKEEVALWTTNYYSDDDKVSKLVKERREKNRNNK